MAKSRVLRFDEPEDVGRRAAEEFIHCAEAAIRKNRRFTVALSGGSTPRRMLELLAAPPLRQRVDWSAVEFFWGDERAVPPDHSDSNYRMAVNALLGSLDLRPTQIHRIHGEREGADEAACAYQAEIAYVVAWTRMANRPG